MSELQICQAIEIFKKNDKVLGSIEGDYGDSFSDTIVAARISNTNEQQFSVDNLKNALEKIHKLSESELGIRLQFSLTPHYIASETTDTMLVNGRFNAVTIQQIKDPKLKVPMEEELIGKNKVSDWEYFVEHQLFSHYLCNLKKRNNAYNITMITKNNYYFPLG